MYSKHNCNSYLNFVSFICLNNVSTTDFFDNPASVESWIFAAHENEFSSL